MIEKKLQNTDISLMLDRMQHLAEMSLLDNAKFVKKYPDYTIQVYFVGEVLRIDVIPAKSSP